MTMRKEHPSVHSTAEIKSAKSKFPSARSGGQNPPRRHSRHPSGGGELHHKWQVFQCAFGDADVDVNHHKDRIWCARSVIGKDF